MIQNIAFLTTFAALPATAPESNAHIIDVGAVGASTAYLQDAVVTLLYKISPETLTTFLDTTVAEFRLTQQSVAEHARDELVVMKRGNKVIVGIVTEFLSLDILEFGNLVRLDIAADGAWKITYVSYRDYFRYSWDDVWAGETIDRRFSFFNMRARPGDTGLEMTERLKHFPRELSREILERQMWDPMWFKSTLITGWGSAYFAIAKSSCVEESVVGYGESEEVFLM